MSRIRTSVINRAVAHNKKLSVKGQPRPSGLRSFRIVYRKKSNGRVVKRKIDPLEVRNNIMVAYDHRRKGIRSFHLDRIHTMEKTAFWNGFLKQASVAAELAGLGMLAVPSAMHLAKKPIKEDTAHKLELAGLGTLAAPYAFILGKKIFRRGR